MAREKLSRGIMEEGRWGEQFWMEKMSVWFVLAHGRMITFAAASTKHQMLHFYGSVPHVEPTVISWSLLFV